MDAVYEPLAEPVVSSTGVGVSVIEDWCSCSPAALLLANELNESVREAVDAASDLSVVGVDLVGVDLGPLD